MTKQMDGSMLVAKTLKRLGVTHIFGVPAGPSLTVMQTAVNEGIRFIGVRHEQAAVMMSLAFSYVRKGSLGVALVGSGPAISNTVTGLHVGLDNCMPALVLGGTSPLRGRGKGDFQEANGEAIAKPVSKWATTVYSAERIPDIIATAYRHAVSGRPGPVFVDLPADVLDTPIGQEVLDRAPELVLPSQPGGDPTRIARAARYLAQARRPLLLIGKGARWVDSPGDLQKLVEAVSMPFLPSPMGRGAIPDDHPLCASTARSFVLGNADVVLVLGARFNWTFGLGRAIPPDAVVIHVDLNAEDIGSSRPVQVPIAGDIGLTVKVLLEELAKSKPTASRREWLGKVDEARKRNRENVAPLIATESSPMPLHRLFKEIRDVLSRDSIVTVDGQVSLAVGRQMIPTYMPGSRLESGTNGCMGVGVPFAIGAKLARPEAPVISISGDCAFGFNGMEVETAVRYNIPVVFIIPNNDGIVGHRLESGLFPDGTSEPVCTYVPKAHYEMIIQAFGGNGEYVERPEDVGPAITRALASGRPAVINVPVDQLSGGPVRSTSGDPRNMLGPGY